MPSTAVAVPDTIAPAELLERLVAGAPTTLLDVREDAAWRIAGPTAIVVHVPPERFPARAATLARELPAGTVVVCNRGVAAQAAAERLRVSGLRVSVLDGGMRGWIGVLRAVPLELGIAGVAAFQVQRPGRGCLSYLVVADGEALVVDPAPSPAFYVDLAHEAGVEVSHVVDTHLHADHLSGARALAAQAGAALHLPAATLERCRTPPPGARPLHDGDAIVVGDQLVEAVALPGHTSDMTGLRLGERALLGGDSLFAAGIARPDLQRSDADGARAMARTLHATLHERVLALAPDTLLLPGHDDPVVRADAVAPTLAQVRAAVPQLALEDPDRFADALLADMPPRPQNYAEVIAANAGERWQDPDLEHGGNACAA